MDTLLLGLWGFVVLLYLIELVGSGFYYGVKERELLVTGTLAAISGAMVLVFHRGMLLSSGHGIYNLHVLALLMLIVGVALRVFGRARS